MLCRICIIVLDDLDGDLDHTDHLDLGLPREMLCRISIIVLDDLDRDLDHTDNLDLGLT